ncbi:hypothetical protein INT48_003576 [Thamnidium elegans]|uniref:C2H2-type domain-containing protein n=1 Tax=Thamnidium elegans TaxID=101142 RepID=A0A8H7SNZ7_9FUNG|nr:hypothetical protein INT48_003576 [Thamnidium elegans]
MALPSPSDLIPDANDQNNYCSTCDKTFTKRHNYLSHLSCSHLDKMSELYRGIDCKSPVMHRYCADCQKVFLSKIFYQIHLDKIHDIKPSKPHKSLPGADDPDVNDPKNYCSSCDKTYFNKRKYRRHLIEVHNLILPSKAQPRVKASNTKPVVDNLKNYCNVCNRVYKPMESYRCHMFRYHHIATRPTESLSSHVNRNKVPNPWHHAT